MGDCNWHSWSVRQNAGAFRDLRFEELLREQVRLAVPPTHPFAQRRSVSLADATKEPFVGLTREDFPDYNAYLNASLPR
jgi:DNA-binding transcriptional LysR family regulator